MKISYENLMSVIGDIAAAERITKAKLSALSRDMLIYLLHTEDIRPINALMGTDENGSFILTPINWRIAAQYFDHFLPFKSNYKDEVELYATRGDGERNPLVFIEKNKRAWDKKSALIEDWLNDANNDIWVWSSFVETKTAPKDWAKEITRTVSNAVGTGNSKQQGNMNSVDVLCAVLEAEGMDMGQLLAAMDKLTEQEKAA